MVMRMTGMQCATCVCLQPQQEGDARGVSGNRRQGLGDAPANARQGGVIDMSNSYLQVHETLLLGG